MSEINDFLGELVLNKRLREALVGFQGDFPKMKKALESAGFALTDDIIKALANTNLSEFYKNAHIKDYQKEVENIFGLDPQW